MVSQSAGVRWPTRDDYDIAMEHLLDNVLDPELRRGGITTTKSGFITHHEAPDSPNCLYRIDSWMVRCFCRVEDREPEDNITERYLKLSKFVHENRANVSALVPLEYHEKGIKVGFYKRNEFHEVVSLIKEEIVPIIKMPFVSGMSLGTFIAGNYRNSKKMSQLSEAWLRMINEMETVKMAHGDLDLTNVIVQDESNVNLVLKLIDYDNTWIPGFDYMLPEYGHEPFQHPAYFGKSHMFNHKIDRFSALVIYISLKTIALHPDLYEYFRADESRLLFTPADFRTEQNKLPGSISQLRAMNISGLNPYIDELSNSLHETRLPRSLNSIVPLFKVNTSVTEIAPKGKNNDLISKEAKADQAPQPSPIEIVFCYAHEDEDLLNQLKAHLKPLRRKGLISIWYDRDINAGTEWARAIDEHLNSAHIILLLVSPDFINSDYCYDIQVTRAIERHQRREAIVIPVILRPVDWRETALHILHPLPKDGIPVVKLSYWKSVDDALLDVEEGIKKICYGKDEWR
jgi:hypothetical protein